MRRQNIQKQLLYFCTNLTGNTNILFPTMFQPRHLLTSLACGNLGTGIFVVPFAVYPSLYNCWPYGEALCFTQALLFSTLSQQNAMTLMLMAIDRYVALLHPLKYHKIASRKVRKNHHYTRIFPERTSKKVADISRKCVWNVAEFYFHATNFSYKHSWVISRVSPK